MFYANTKVEFSMWAYVAWTIKNQGPCEYQQQMFPQSVYNIQTDHNSSYTQKQWEKLVMEACHGLYKSSKLDNDNQFKPFQ